MSGIAVGESSTPSKKARTPKVLDHLEIHPKLGGGHIVRHVYTGYEHDPKSVEFNKTGIAKGGEHIASHLAKHAGLPTGGPKGEEYDEHDESETEDEIRD
jgi:hypothetical protein